MSDGEVFERLIREQLVEAEEINEKDSTRDRGDPNIVYRWWEIVIPSFEGPNGRRAPLLTAWTLDPRRNRPHFTNAYRAGE